MGNCESISIGLPSTQIARRETILKQRTCQVSISSVWLPTKIKNDLKYPFLIVAIVLLNCMVINVPRMAVIQ